MTKPSVHRSLTRYRDKRDFAKTAEPSGAEGGSARGSSTESEPNQKSLAFVIQKHAASHLHFDLRLELDGVMKSWAVPKGPSLDPSVKRLAMEVEDHPMEYNSFEGTIPKGQYGGGTVMLWDRGTYSPDDLQPGERAQDAVRRGLRSGKLAFTFHGERLHGSFALVRTRRTEGRAQWLLIKHDGDTRHAPRDIVAEVNTSVTSGRTMDAIAASGGRSWQSNRVTDGATIPFDAQDEAAITPMEPSGRASAPGAGFWAIEPYYQGTRVIVHVADGSVRGMHLAQAAKTAGPAEDDSSVERRMQHIRDALGNFSTDHEGAFVFDAILLNGERAALVIVDMLAERGVPLVDEPWLERRMRLDALVGIHRRAVQGRAGRSGSPSLQISEYFVTTGDEAVADARRLKWTRSMAKRIDSPYESGRSNMWKGLS
jgi:bifunctional non-homologous end joining protein LigD